MIVLDTQHASQLQRDQSADAARLSARLDTLPSDDVFLTIVTPHEQLRSCLGRIHSSQGEAQLGPFALLGRLLDFYADWQSRILPFDSSALANYRGFGAKLIRDIGPMDAMIAAITASRGATLLSANLRDFEQVPGLRVENWLSG